MIKDKEEISLWTFPVISFKLNIKYIMSQAPEGDPVSSSCPSSVSHSVMSEMQLIEQETPVGSKLSSRSKLDMFDEPGFTSGPPK